MTQIHPPRRINGADGCRARVEEVMEDIRVEARGRLDGVTSLVEEGESCGLCGGVQVVAILHLAVNDPAARGEIVKVDSPACATCEARLQPRIQVRLDPEQATRLILAHMIDIEPYERPVVVATPTRRRGSA